MGDDRIPGRQPSERCLHGRGEGNGCWRSPRRVLQTFERAGPAEESRASNLHMTQPGFVVHPRERAEHMYVVTLLGQGPRLGFDEVAGGVTACGGVRRRYDRNFHGI